VRPFTTGQPMRKKSAWEGPSCATQSGAQRRFRSFLRGAVTATCAVIAAALASTTGPASAKTTLIDASYAVAISPDNGTPTSEESAHPVSASGEPQGSSGTATGGYYVLAATSRDEIQASIQLSGTPSNPPNFGTVGLAAISDYQIAVAVRSGRKPPPSITTVPIEITITASASCSDAATQAQAKVEVGLLAPLDAGASCGYGHDIPSVVDSETSLVSIGDPVAIEKAAQGGVGNFTGDGASASIHAVVDPTFEIDPSFAYADDFELDYSPGYNPSGSAAPEPSTWLLLASGFGALILHRGSIRRRSRAAN
jgi:hypothetical protein